MQTVTKPIMLDETGLLIVDALSGLTDAVKPDAVNIPYDNTDSGLEAETVQGAIDENAGVISELNSSLTIKSDMKTLTTNGNGVVSITGEFNLDMSKTILLGVFLEGRYKYENYYTRNASTGVTQYNIAIIEAANQNYVRVANTSVVVYIRYLELN